MRETHGQPNIRALRAADSLERLTELVHAAYAPHAARGLRYWGTHQTVDETAKRFASGHGFIAELNGEYVGTVIARPPQAKSPVPLYRQPNTWSISQLAVLPKFKGQGFGRALHEAAVDHALKNEGTTMALDTAAPATALISMYEAWGYEIVGQHSWQPFTNFISVLMSRPLLERRDRLL